MTAREGDEWTRGAAKWAAVAVLGVMSLAGLVWSVKRSVAHATHVRVVQEDRSVDEPLARAPRGESTLPAREQAKANGPSQGLKLDLNSASAAELELLPGIGPALAARVVEHRARAGGFRSVDELVHVKGIGEKLLARVRDRVFVRPGSRAVQAEVGQTGDGKTGDGKTGEGGTGDGGAEAAPNPPGAQTPPAPKGPDEPRDR